MNPPGHEQQQDAQLRAEALARLAAAPAAETPGRQAEELLHELQVHQIELEMQNEALRQAQIALEESRDRYVDFYEFSPVGYFTLTGAGLIAQMNLAAAELLGATRKELLRRRFSPSVAAEDRDRWHRHFMKALEPDAKLHCDLALRRPDGTRIDVRLDSLHRTTENQASELRVVLTDISERKQAEHRLFEMASALEATVAERTRELRTLSAQLSLTEERERRRLAQELHDNLGQLLAIIKIKLSSLVTGVPESSVDQINALVDQAEQAARTLTLELSPPVLHTLGLVPALEFLAEEMHRLYGVNVHIDAEHPPQPLVDEIQAMLYRAVRELLINVARHAEVREASLHCGCDGNRLMLTVSDDGCGFDPAALHDILRGRHSFGLSSIHERIINIGGQMEIDSSPGHGTTISLTLPCSIAAKEHRP